MKILWSSLFLIAATALAQAQSPKLDPLETGRQYTAWFYAGETGRLWELFSPEMKQAIGGAEKLKTFRDQVGDQLGTETAVVDEKVEPSGLYQVYTRKVRFSKLPDRRFMTLWTLNSKGTITGFFIRPDTSTEAPSSHLDYQTKTPLRLPFDGEWLVGWGGRTVAQNYHAAYSDQRFAYDLLVMRDGKSHTGDGTSVEQYFCFGQPILAPGAGTVAEATDGLPDNKPGVMDRDHPTGNHLILDHGNGEFSFLAHLKQGSVAVKVGDRVKPGDKLGLCGNSGNTSEPHLHYHLQTTAKFGVGEGLPAQFLSYIADGKEVARGEPVQGQRIRNRPAPVSAPSAAPRSGG